MCALRDRGMQPTLHSLWTSLYIPHAEHSEQDGPPCINIASYQMFTNKMAADGCHHSAFLSHS